MAHQSSPSTEGQRSAGSTIPFYQGREGQVSLAFRLGMHSGYVLNQRVEHIPGWMLMVAYGASASSSA